MRTILTIILTLFLGLKVFATAQYPDKIIYNGKEYSLHSNPLEAYFEKNPDKRPKSGIMSTALWRGYVATFEVKDNQLYLKDIEIEYQDTTSKESYNYKWRSVIKDVFPDQKEIKIDWLTGLLVLPHGKLVNYYVHSGYESFYETELVLTFKNGILIEQHEYDNSKSYKSIFTEKQDSLQNFIYSNIEWSKIPDLKNEKVRVFISIQSGETMKPDSILIVRGSNNEILNQEALRVVNLIPEWDVYYRLGEVYRMKWTIPIIFDEQRRKKYAR